MSHSLFSLHFAFHSSTIEFPLLTSINLKFQWLELVMFMQMAASTYERAILIALSVCTTFASSNIEFVQELNILLI